MRRKLILWSVGIITGSLSGNAQNVGIGTATPDRAKFEVSGAVGSTNAILGGDGTGISFQRNSPSVGFNQYYNGQNYYINNGSAFVQWLDILTGSLYFDIFTATGTANAVASNPQRAMTIRWNGNVSIEAGESNASLFIGNGFGNRSTRFQGTTYHSEFNKPGGNYHTYINGGKAGSDVYINDAHSGVVHIAGVNGNVGINKVPGVSLDIQQVNGRGFVLVEPSTFHNWEFVTVRNQTDPASDYYVFYNGQYKGNFFYADGSYNPISDGRLKKEIQPVNAALSKLLLLRPVTYQMRYSGNTSRHIGLIAQEVKQLFPELVEQIHEKDTGYPGINEIYMMNYDGLAPLVIAAIQEQQDKIKLLKARIFDLRNRVEKIKSMISNK